MSITVCIATCEYPPTIGGVGVSAQRIAMLLAKRGYSIHVAVLEWDSDERSGRTLGLEITSALEAGVTVHRVRVPSRTGRYKERDMEADFYVALRELHRRYGFQLFHCFYLRAPAFACALLAVEHGIPYLCSARGNDLHKHAFAPGAVATLSWILRNASWSTYVSDSLRRRALALVPDIAARTSTFWNSIDATEFDTLPEVKTVGRRAGITIGTLGRLRDKKGCETLLAACASVAASHDISVVLIGDFADSEREYWQLVLAASPIAGRIATLGLMDRRHALAHLRVLDIVVFCSVHDGCPNALLEAMVAARPIVGSRVDALGEIIEHGRNGLLADPLDVQEFAKMLDMLIRDESQRLRLGSAARADALLRFRVEVESDGWNQAYERALRGRATEAGT
jgi:glycosyltransferase involved in cell wall biosynthesis